MRCSVIDAQSAGAPANIHAERPPGEGRLKDTLTEIAGEEKTVCSIGPEGGEAQAALR